VAARTNHGAQAAGSRRKRVLATLFTSGYSASEVFGPYRLIPEERAMSTPTSVPSSSTHPNIPPPLPPAPLKIWTEREGAVPAAKPQTYTSVIEEILQPTPDVRLFRLTLEGYREVIPFIAGQFIQFLWPHPDKDHPEKMKDMVRSYSIASPPEERRFLEFCIKLVVGGAFTPSLWNLRVGDKLKMRGPFGKFTIHDPLDANIVFIATGTGIAPFWGMIYHLLKTGTKHKIVLIFGVRYEIDVVYEQEFKKLAAEHPNFTPVFTLSRPQNPATWWGETGYVQNLLEKYVTDPASYRAYICGLTLMIDQTVAKLQQMGFTADRIHYERYD
jgi:ferredoxin-NADP reductase